MPTEEYLHAGDYFGTSAILGSGQRTRHSTLTAVTDVSVVALSKDDFEIDGTDGERRLSSGYAAPGAGSGSGARRASSGSREGGGSGGGARNFRSGGRRSRGARERSLRFTNMMASTTPLSYAVASGCLRRATPATRCSSSRGATQVSFTHLTDGRGIRAPPASAAARRAQGEAAQRDGHVCLKRRLRGSPRLARRFPPMRGSWDVAHDLVAVSERHLKEKERRVKFIRT